MKNMLLIALGFASLQLFSAGFEEGQFRYFTPEGRYEKINAPGAYPEKPQPISQNIFTPAAQAFQARVQAYQPSKDSYWNFLGRRFTQETSPGYETQALRPQRQPMGQAALPFVRQQAAKAQSFLSGWKERLGEKARGIVPTVYAEEKTEEQKRKQQAFNHIVQFYLDTIMDTLNESSPFDNLTKEKIFGGSFTGLLRYLEQLKYPFVARGVVIEDEPSLPKKLPQMVIWDGLIKNTNLQNRDLGGIIADGAKIIDSNLESTKFVQGSFNNATIEPQIGDFGDTLQETDFSKAHLTGTTFKINAGPSATGTVMFTGTKFDDANLKGVKIEFGPGVRDIDLTTTTIHKANNTDNVLKLYTEGKVRLTFEQLEEMVRKQKSEQAKKYSGLD